MVSKIQQDSHAFLFPSIFGLKPFHADCMPRHSLNVDIAQCLIGIRRDCVLRPGFFLLLQGQLAAGPSAVVFRSYNPRLQLNKCAAEVAQGATKAPERHELHPNLHAIARCLLTSLTFMLLEQVHAATDVTGFGLPMAQSTLSELGRTCKTQSTIVRAKGCRFQPR